MSTLSDDGLTPIQQPTDTTPPVPNPQHDEAAYQPDYPRAVSVAGPIPVSPPSPNNPANDGLTPVGDDDLSTFAPPIVDHSLFKDSVLSTLHNQPSDQGFDNAVALNMGDLKWPLMAFKGVSPDVAAQVDQLAKSNGIPYNLASAGKDDLGVLQQARSIYNSLSATDAQGNFLYPQTRQWLNDPVNLAKAKDDVQALTDIESTIRGQSQAGESSFYQTLRNAASNTETFLGNTSHSVAAFSNMLAGASRSLAKSILITPALTSVNNNESVSAASMHPEQLARVDQPLTDLPHAIQDPFSIAATVKQHADANDAATLAGKSIGGEFSKGNYGATAQLVAGQLAPMAATLGFTAVDPALGLAQGADSSATTQYQNDLDAGKEPGMAGIDAGLNFAINAVGGHTLGTVGQFERMKALFSQPVARETATALWGRIAKQSLISATQGAVGQGGIQAADDAADYATGNPDALNNEQSKVLTASALGFIADGSLAGPHGALEGVRQLAAQEQGATAWERLTGSAQQSKLLKRDPDALANVIDQNLTAAGQPTTVGVDADKLTTFFQSRPANDLNNFAADMGLKPEEITNAAATGGAVDLPIGQYQAKYVGTPLDQAISKDLRFTPGGLSENELQDQIAHVQQLSEGIKAELAKTTSGTGNQLPAQIATMRDTLMTPKEEGGMGYTADQADSQLAVLTAGLGRIAAHRGESVDDTLNRMGLSLKVGDIASDGGKNLLVRNQGSNNNESTNEERARAGDPEAVANLVRDGAGTRGEVHGSELQTGEALHAADSEGQRHEALVESYRKVATKLGKDLPSSGLPDDAVPFREGSEHHTSSSETDHRIYKILKAPEDYGISATGEKSNPLSYLERHAIQNKEFEGDTRWEGVNEYGQTVTSQPHIKGVEPTNNEVRASMEAKGFSPKDPEDVATRQREFDENKPKRLATYQETRKRLEAKLADPSRQDKSEVEQKIKALDENFNRDENGGIPITDWVKNGIHVADAQSFNFIKDEQGKIHAIDLAMSRTPETPADIRHQDARGAITFADGKTTIHLFKTADFSTLAHETGHLFLHEMQNLVAQGKGDDSVKADLQTLLDYAGVKPGEKLSIDQEENIVKSFESYLRDGKAPSIELSGPFSRFRTWLSSIYRSITSLGVTPTDEVKQVFDRMLASEDDISNAQHYYSRTNEVLNLIKGEEKDKEQVREKLAKVKQTELDKGVRAYMKSYLQAIGGVAEVRSKAKEVVEKQPIYQALDSAKDGKLDEEDLKARLGAKGFKEFVAKFPNLVKENGEHTLDGLAAKHNFQSPETLADNFMAAVPKSEAIKNYTSRLLDEKEQQIREEIMRQGATPADGVMHTEGSLAYLIAETNLMAKQLEKGKPVRIDARAYQAAARSALGAMPSSKAVQYSAFAKTEARLAKQVLDLAKKGQWEDGKPGADGRVKEGAITLRKKQIAQHVMVQEAIKIRAERDAILKRFAPKALEAKLKNVENAYVDPVRQILSNYGLSDTKPSTPYDLTKLQDVDPTLFAQLPTWILNGENKGDYKNLTWDQLQAVDSAARAVMGFGNDLRKSDLAMKERTIGELVEKSVATIDKLPENNVRQLGNSVLGNAYTRTLQKLDWLKSHLTKAQTLFDILDNFSIQRNGTAGTMRQLFDGLRVGEHNQSEAQRAVYNQAKPHLAILGKAAKRMRKENGTNFDIEGVQKPASYALRGDSKWTPEQLIAYMLNTGAEGNISALKNAFGHGPAEMDKVAQQFSTEELHAIDGLRDAVGTLYDGLNETNMKLYNRGVDKVDAVPQDFTDNSGAGVHLKGGYWPLVFDYGINHLEGKVTDQDILANQIKGFMRSSKPEDGMTKSRVIGHALAPRLDMGVFADHVDDTTRFVHMAPLVRDISRVMQNKDWKEAAIRKVGASQYDQAVDWLKYQANPGRKQTSDLMTGLDKWADAGRTLATESALGFNFGGGLAWRTSMINSAVALGGWRHIVNGLTGLGTRGLGTSTLGLSNTKTWHMIEEKSNLLKTREAKGVRDLQQDVAKIKWNRFNYQIPGTKIQVNNENFKHFIYEWAKMNDRAVVAPVWMGAYQKFRNEMGEASMTDEEREKGAVNYADSIIQNSQPSSLNVDMNSMQRNQSAWVKMFTMFLSYPYTISNRFGYMYQAFRAGAITPAQYVSHVVQEGFLEPFARVGVHAAAKFTLPTAAALALAPMSNLIGAIPGLGSLWNMAINNFDPSELSPSFDVFKKAGNIYEDVIHDKDVTKLAWDAARLGGYLTGVPVLNLAKTLLDWQAEASGSKNPYK